MILFVVVLRATFERYTQAANSMLPTIAKGDLLVVRPGDGVERGDIIVFTAPVGGRMVKRVIALGGETVELRDNRAVVNGVPLVERYAAANDESLPESARFRDMHPDAVAQDGLFVLGDNRDHSNDSRFWGDVKRESVRVRVVLVISKTRGVWRP